MVTLATLPLPNSYLFHQSLSGSDLIDESDLLQWDNAPPYSSLPPPNTPDEERFTRNLCDVMHGRWLRLERESRAHRAAIFNSGDISKVQKEIRGAWEACVRGWDELHSYVTNLQACTRHQVMATCYQQWQARKIVHYQHEYDLLVVGKNPYA
jgi:hypothetical protein